MGKKPKLPEGTTETIALTLKIMDGRNVIKAWDYQVTLPISSSVAFRDLKATEAAFEVLKVAVPHDREVYRQQSKADLVKAGKLAAIEVTLRKLALPEGHITRTIKKLRGLPLDSAEWKTFTTMKGDEPVSTKKEDDK